MKILMLVNWKIEYAKEPPVDKQPPDYYVEGQPYWFFRYFEKREDIQVDVVDVKSFPWLENFEKNKIRFYIWQTLKVLPKLNRYDLVLSHGMQSGIVLCLWRRLFGKGKYKHVVFDIGAFNSARESGKSLKLMQFASKSLDGVIYHTENQIKYYEKCHPWLIDKSQFIVFGTDTDFFVREESQNNVEGKSDSSTNGDGEVQQSFVSNTEMYDVKNANNHESYILSIGYHQRDWDTMLKAYKRIQTDVKLRLIGNDKIHPEDARVEVLAGVPIKELMKQIQNSEFCILPLEWFNYSYGQMSLLQQMALEKAVITSDVPSLSAYTKDGENCLLYSPQNVEQLKQKIELLLENKELQQKIAKQAKQDVIYNYSEETMAKQIEEYLYSFSQQ